MRNNEAGIPQIILKIDRLLRLFCGLQWFTPPGSSWCEGTQVPESVPVRLSLRRGAPLSCAVDETRRETVGIRIWSSARTKTHDGGPAARARNSRVAYFQTELMPLAEPPPAYALSSPLFLLQCPGAMVSPSPLSPRIHKYLTSTFLKH